MPATIELHICRRPDTSLSAELRAYQRGVTVLAPAQAVTINGTTLLALTSLPTAYGTTLAEMVFPAPLRAAWERARGHAEGTGQGIHLRVLLDDRSGALHALRWELLRDPATNAALAQQEDGSLARLIASDSLHDPDPPAKPALRALVAVAGPSDHAIYELAPVDVAGEAARAREALGTIEPDLLTDTPSGLATLANIRDGMRAEAHILYLICHGKQTPQGTVLYLVGDNGMAAPITGEDLAATIAALDKDHRPLLAVLVACESASQEDAPLASVGPLLARAGVPAVIAMQAKISMAAAAQLTARLLRELARDGRIDRALAAARKEMGDAWWVPVLWLRWRDGRLWQDEARRDPWLTEVRFDDSLLRIEQWAQLPPYQNQFVTDETVTSRVTEFRRLIEDSGAIVRIVGAAGNGKTRLVLEALRESSLAPSVLYARQLTDVSRSLVAQLERAPETSYILVVDEVDDAGAVHLREDFHRLGSKVRLVTIGLDASSRLQPGMVQIEGVSEELLIAMISAITPGLPEDVTRSVAGLCEHSPKLAVLIANRIREDPSLVEPQRLLRDGTIYSVLSRYLDIEHSGPEWMALASVALMMRLGWLDEVEEESVTLYQTLQIAPKDARRYVEQLHERFGVAPLAGRFRYVSPAILADHLALQHLSSWTGTELRTILAVFTATMSDSFARRVRRLSALLPNRRAIEEVLLGDQGPFRGLADLKIGKVATVLSHLAGPFATASLQALHRIISTASLDELRLAKNSRRDLVRALDELLWPVETFEQASCLLLRLAVAENETWSNNATGLWIETFQTILGRTAANAQIRLRVLHHAATYKEPQARRLAAQALQAALKMDQVSRGGMPPTDVEGMPGEEWRPATWGEWTTAVVGYLDVLTPLLTDDHQEVRGAAAVALGEGLEAAIRLPEPAFTRWQASTHVIAGAEETLRSPVVKAIEWAKHRWKKERNKPFDVSTGSEDEPRTREEWDQQTRVLDRKLAVLQEITDDLEDKSFSGRLRAAVSRTPWEWKQHNEEGEQAQQTTLEALATETLVQPSLLNDAWTSLLALQNAWPGLGVWAETLGRLDRSRVFASTLENLAVEHQHTVMWHSLYELAYARTAGDPAHLDRRVEDLRADTVPGMVIFDLLYRAGYSTTRYSIARLLIETHEVSAEAAYILGYRPWGDAIPPEEARGLASVLAAQAPYPVLAAPFVATYLRMVPTALATLRSIALTILQGLPTTEEGNIPTNDWEDLALMYVETEQITISKAALQLMAGNGASMTNHVVKVLQAAWEAGDRAQIFAEVIGPALSSGVLANWYTQRALAGFPISDLTGGYLTAWVAENPERRAVAVAAMLGSPSAPMSDVHAQILEAFDAYGVGNVFAAAFRSGTWWDSHTSWVRKRLEIARLWLDDPRAVVRSWAQQLIPSLENELGFAEARDAEERFR